MKIIHKIDETVRKYNMLSSGDSVAAGVSGGKDSMLLLYYLLSKREELKLRITVLNVEHGIRGEASKRDSEFVKEFCEKNNLEFRLLEINATAEAKAAGLGVEEYSRNRRYAFFSSLGADKIATAHSLSDNVETLLFRLARGTSLSGATGIPPVRDNIIRPLIECTADEIIDACKELEIPYVTDETNSDNEYSRNRIRNLVIPVLKSINPDAESAIGRFISCANEDESCLKALAEGYVDEALSCEKLRGEKPSVIKRAIQLYASSFGITLDEKHLVKVAELIDKRGRYQLKGELFAVSDSETLRFKAISENELDFTVKSDVVDVSDCNLYKKEFTFSCDYDKISGNVYVKHRQEGDRITPAGRGCSKSLKKLFNELRIPADERLNVPVICDGEGIIGVYGYTVSERVKKDKDTKRVFLLNVLTEDNN